MSGSVPAADLRGGSARPAALLLAAAGALGGAAAAEVPRVWSATQEFQIEMAGTVLPGGRLYQAAGTSTMLVIAPELRQPLLLRVTEREILPLSPAAVTPGPAEEDVDVDETLAQGAPMPFTRDAEGVIFFVDGKRVRIVRRPPLVGAATVEEVLVHSPHYRAGMEAYTPSPADVARLRSIPFPVEVQIFFGTWCPHCRETVPRFFKCLSEAANAKIQTSCMGVPRPPFTDYPPAKEKNIKGVPTFIVYAEGKEIGRIQTIPAGSSVEHELVKILADFRPTRG